MARDREQIYEASDWFKEALQKNQVGCVYYMTHEKYPVYVLRTDHGYIAFTYLINLPVAYGEEREYHIHVYTSICHLIYAECNYIFRQKSSISTVKGVLFSLIEDATTLFVVP